MTELEVKNLYFRYGKSKKAILDDLSFSCKTGSVTVLLGLNGCGKTTLIKCLAGILRPEAGDITLSGRPLCKLTVGERADKIAYVAQRIGTAEDFLVREYLLFGKVNRLRFYESPGKEDEDEAAETAERFGIAGLLNKKLCEISGGERQIVSICSALMQKTDLLLLDEPTSALDIRNQSAVLSVLKEIANGGKTVILSTHNPNHALFLGAETILMDSGRIVGSGRAEEIISPEKLSRVYGDRVCFSADLPYSEISFC